MRLIRRWILIRFNRLSLRVEGIRLFFIEFINSVRSLCLRDFIFLFITLIIDIVFYYYYILTYLKIFIITLFIRLFILFILFISLFILFIRLFN